MTNKRTRFSDKAAKKHIKEKAKAAQRPMNFPVPELDGVFGSPCVFKVRKAALDDHIRASTLGNKQGHVLAWVLNKIKKGEKLDLEGLIGKINNEFEEGSDGTGLHENTMFEIDLFRRVVAFPKFNLKETISLSHAFPHVVHNIVEFALGMNQ
jgi:hypothetical protein